MSVNGDREEVVEINISQKVLDTFKLNLDDMYKNPSICLIGMRGSGKSWIIRDILRKLDTYDEFQENTLIIAKSEKMSTFYGNFFSRAKIIYTYDTDALNEYLSDQKQRISEAEKTGIPCNGCVVLDDCLASKGTWMNDEVISDLFYNSKSYQTTFIVAMQFPLGIKPELRSVFDYVFLMSEDFYSNQKRLYDHYADIYPTFDEFRTELLQLTNDFNCMVIDRKNTTKELNDKIFYFKADNEI